MSGRRQAGNALAVCAAWVAVFACAAPVQAQYVEIQNFEVTPFTGVRFGGTFELRPDALVETNATLQDAQSYGVSGEVRFDDFSLVGFRWTRSVSELRFDFPFRPVGPSLGDITLNQFHADFTREWDIREVKGLRSFLTGSVGATHLAASSASDGFTRFSFGFGGGLKLFLGSRLAIRGEANWLPIWIEPEVGSFACGAVELGGCLVVLTGRLTQQFQMSVGPVIRF